MQAGDPGVFSSHGNNQPPCSSLPTSQPAGSRVEAAVIQRHGDRRRPDQTSPTARILPFGEPSVSLNSPNRRAVLRGRHGQAVAFPRSHHLSNSLNAAKTERSGAARRGETGAGCRSQTETNGIIQDNVQSNALSRLTPIRPAAKVPPRSKTTGRDHLTQRDKTISAGCLRAATRRSIAKAIHRRN
ncbi:hypothetical protein CA85_32910 [Allorhodopirellula solitaria]|uniref:Uncharacterized protein n=1 Tax=Allorhodopirellula solitaria TaxID=2527987 RepID=A0A5C5XQB5_9BACT|nr:hypothetical protein CA85_32910 [Allorhodopirellula solitaria]